MTASPLAPLLANAAAILARQAAPEGPGRDLLQQLDYLDDDGDAMPHRVALLRAAAHFQRIFTIKAQDAPGLVAFGAEADPVCIGVANASTGSISGTGLTFRQAFESCVGEGSEYISSFLTQDDTVLELTHQQVEADVTQVVRTLWQRLQPNRRDPAATTTGWVQAANLANGAPTLLPVDLCLRRPAATQDLVPPWPLSIGCGAGPDPLTATLHGLCELIERDAVALWLRGGARPRVVPPGPGATLLSQLRETVTSRRTWLLDITSDLGVPVVAALACNQDGFGLSRGFACRPTLDAAANSALLELAQMELAYRLSETKRSVRGEAALNEIDRQHIDRHTQLDVAKSALLHPLAPPEQLCDLSTGDKIGQLASIRQRLEAVGVEVYAMNLTRPALGISVTKAFAPALEAGLAGPPGARLRAMATRSGVDLASPVVV
jgi:ribosomal protein S12 methylthiotransferase accessory factor